MSIDILLGVDVGTSDSKVLVTRLDGSEITAVATPTVWRNHGGKFTDCDASTLADGVFGLLGRAVAAATDLVGPVTVAAVAITGMAEAGVLLDADNRPVHPVLAWFDPRGGEEMLRLPQELLTEFCGRTGLPVSALCTVAKLAWMREQGTDLAAHRWLNVPEYLAFRLGGEQVGEMSLVARTGLMDQDTETLWPEMLEALGATADLIAPLVPAGTPLGRISGNDVPTALHGAVVTVAGHDHPVAAVGCGVVGSAEVFDSFGTAEALVRTVDGNLAFDARERLGREGINSVHHVLEGRRLLLGGTKAGLLLRRTLNMLGAGEPSRRAELDAAAVAAAEQYPGAVPGISVSGALNADGTLKITATGDDITPGMLWHAVVAHGIDEAARCLELMEREVGPTSAAVVAGGWMRMQSVRRSKQDSLPDVRFSDRSQAGAFGASMFAAHAHAHAENLRAAGDPTGVAVTVPVGPSEQFAADYTRTTRSQTPADQPAVPSR
ncbi:FGGY-family carbohydrate kinase [Nakamurella alba]|uniref:FGGY-family carbohydrate kinase n=1 Tax=Nakamurella alba TaxID=2665158 RepID=UPI0018A954E7|nr:FGGY family carbohydrate kinase [Nakamurella alba]